MCHAIPKIGKGINHEGKKMKRKIPIATQNDSVTIKDYFDTSFDIFTQLLGILCQISQNLVAECQISCLNPGSAGTS